MEFNESRPIYVQIADRLREAVLRGVWSDDERIPSIREMAADAEVNPNTITRTYSLLQDQGVILNRRGIGYFIVSGASENVKAIMKQEFIENELPEFFRKASVLGITMDELSRLYGEYGSDEDRNTDRDTDIDKETVRENSHENQ